jgi:hypothetical protein
MAASVCSGDTRLKIPGRCRPPVVRHAFGAAVETNDVRRDLKAIAPSP